MILREREKGEGENKGWYLGRWKRGKERIRDDIKGGGKGERENKG